MDQAVEITGGLTAVDLAARFGAVPLHRIRHQPAPGTATEQDVVRIHDSEDRLYELVDGVLLEKTVGTYESYLAALLVQLLGTHARENDLGIVLGADGMLRLAPGMIRIPDVSFISWQRLPEGKVPRAPVAALAPDLAVEVISRGNTPEEMKRKLGEYFESGVRQVWYIFHTPRREVLVYTGPEDYTVVGETETLHAADVVPGFGLPLADLFAEPGQGSLQGIST